MLNKEKYKDRLEEILSVTIAVSESGDIFQCTNTCTNTVNCKDCIFFGYDCAYKASKWLNSECKEPILTEEEKEYLSAVIKPFRKKIAYIRKKQSLYKKDKDKKFILIVLCDGDYMYFPFFENDAMYQGMELGREYTIEELGL